MSHVAKAHEQLAPRARFILAGLLLVVGTPRVVAETPPVDWADQFGTSSWDTTIDLAINGSGHIFVTGHTRGSLGGASAGGADVFISKWNINGDLLWTSQEGSTYDELVQGVAADELGNSYIAGLTEDAAHQRDAFVSRYDPNGQRLWTHQFGSSPVEDVCFGVAADVSGVYVAGGTGSDLWGGGSLGQNDAFLRKYDPNGRVIWTDQFGSSGGEYADAVTLDGAGNVYVAGTMHIGGINSDAFVRKYDPNGQVLWARQIGSSDNDWDVSRDLTVDALGNVYLVGTTDGSFGQPSAGGLDVFLCKYDANGDLKWSVAFGSLGDDGSHAVCTDASGSVYITGYATGDLGDGHVGQRDVFLAKYDPNGLRVWMSQFGTAEGDEGSGVAIDGLGHIYLSGRTFGSLFGPQLGDEDAFIASIPEPAALSILALGGLILFQRRRRQRRLHP